MAMTRRRFALLFSLLLIPCGVRAQEAPGAAAPQRGLRVLFIGNSLTQANDLPLIVQAMAKASARNLQAEDVTLGGASLADHWADGEALRMIDRGKWDVVVLQHGPSTLPESRAELREWTVKFAERIRKAGARPALFMVWPPKDRLAYFDDVREAYSLAAQDVQGIFFPAGEAWRSAWQRLPSAPLYSSDNFHPSQAGSYAAALSIYGILHQRTPVGLPARLELKNKQVITIPADLAKTLQEAAEEANKKYGRP